MFDGIIDKFQSLQENLTTTLRGFSSNDPHNKKQVLKKPPSVNLNAGVDILDKFQSSWSELHEASQLNAIKAEEVDSIIYKLHKGFEKQCRDFNQMTNVLVSLPEVVFAVNELSEKLVVLEDLFESVEKSLIELEDIIDTREFENKQLDQRFQLAMYKEKKLAALENVRLNYAEKLRKEELRQRTLLKESEEIFKQDLKFYKETNPVPKMEFAKSKTGVEEIEKLEDITLDCDDTTALDEFLDETKEAKESPGE